MEQRLSVFDLSAVFTFGCIQKMRSASILPAAALFPHRSQANSPPTAYNHHVVLRERCPVVSLFH